MNPHIDLVRKRASAACETCRLKKVKCNEKQPVCSYCQRHNFPCDYRLQNDLNKDHILSLLLDRLSQVEEKLAALLLANTKSGGNTNETTNNATTLDTAIGRLDPTTRHEDKVSVSSCSCHGSILKDSPSALDYFADSDSTYSSRVEFATVPRAVKPMQKNSVYNTRHLNPTTLACEEFRPPLPVTFPDDEMTQPRQIMQPVEHFYQKVHSLWPVVCEKVTYEMALSVRDQGYQDNLQSCLVLLMVALSKAYQTQEPLENGIPEFQRAIQLLCRVGVQFTLEYSQAQVLSAVFLLKMGRLLDFWSYLHMGCTILYKVIHQDATTCRERNEDEKNSTLRLYWLCYNLERDLNNEIDLISSTPLFHLEDTLLLPHGCDETGTMNLPEPFRSTQTFFLAEMSLKSILARIIATPDSDFYIERKLETNIKESPLFKEFKTQLDRWISSLPTFVGWTIEPAKGQICHVATRLKLVYWFARLSLYRPLMLYVLKEPSQQLPFAVWTLFQDGLLAGLNMLRVSLNEETDLDVIIGNRLISTMALLKHTVAKNCFPSSCEEDVTDIVKRVVEMLQKRLACKSEWITHRLHTL